MLPLSVIRSEGELTSPDSYFKGTGKLVETSVRKWVVWVGGGRVEARTLSPSASGRLISRPAASDANSWWNDAVRTHPCFSRDVVAASVSVTTKLVIGKGRLINKLLLNLIHFIGLEKQSNFCEL